MSKIQPIQSPCYCVNFRRAANLLTKYYDEAFAEIRLTANQFFLLSSLTQLGDCNKSELAQYTRLDRTTIIRNLSVLHKKEFIQEAPGKNKRNKVIQLTQAGAAAVTQGDAIWETLQAHTRQAMGEENLPVLWHLFASLEGLVPQSSVLPI